MRSPLEQDMSKGFVVWFTGLSGAGKSTIAAALQSELARRGRSSELLDGDEVRTEIRRAEFDTMEVANAISARGLAGDVYRAATVRTGKLVR